MSGPYRDRGAFDRVANQAALYPIIEAWAGLQHADDAVTRLNDAGVPASPP